jgi:hypothetical protein
MASWRTLIFSTTSVAMKFLKVSTTLIRGSRDTELRHCALRLLAFFFNSRQLYKKRFPIYGAPHGFREPMTLAIPQLP